VAIRPPKHNSQGFTLIEMIVILGIVGIVAGFAVPSFLSLNKPLRDGVSQFKSQLNLIRAKAISSNQSYRIKPLYPTRAQYYNAKNNKNSIPRNFIVEYAANCQVSKYGYGVGKAGTTDPKRPVNAAYPTGTPDGWQFANQFDLDLPQEVGISDVSTVTVDGVIQTNGTLSFPPANPTLSTPASTAVEAKLNWSICFDNRGLADKSVQFTLKDYQGNHKARTALLSILKVGGVDITTYNVDGAPVTDGTPPQPTF
jgi:prepilin-type N-terminal cleavage/methylation domain-containing protein